MQDESVGFTRRKSEMKSNPSSSSRSTNVFESKRYRESDSRKCRNTRVGKSETGDRCKESNSDRRQERSRDCDHTRDRNRERDRDRYRYRYREHDRNQEFRATRDDREDSKKNRRSRSPVSDSKDRFRGMSQLRGNARRFDRVSNKMAQLEKLGIEINTADYPIAMLKQMQERDEVERLLRDAPSKAPTTESETNNLIPGISGRFKEQIERRKQLWSKTKASSDKNSTVCSSADTNLLQSGSGQVWAQTTFAQDNDGRQASKFKRLMGIRGASTLKEAECRDTAGSRLSRGEDVRKRQEELFSNMEQQYEVARTTTHTMRGVGLGFSSYQR